MAFGTEFMMGAGGAEVEEIPVSMSGRGAPADHLLTTIDAGTGAWVVVKGTFSGIGTTSNSGQRPHLLIGPMTHEYPYVALSYGGALATYVTGTTQVVIRSRYSVSDTTFVGTVHVVRL